MFSIVKYAPEYRDDLLFCYLCAQDALDPPPRLREDLLDIQRNYFDTGDMFWVALSAQGRVIGMLGTHTVSPTDLWLKRLFVKPELKRHGIASALLAVALEYAKAKGMTHIHTRFNDGYTEAAQFYPAKEFAEAERSDGLRHLIRTI